MHPIRRGIFHVVPSDPVGHARNQRGTAATDKAAVILRLMRRRRGWDQNIPKIADFVSYITDNGLKNRNIAPATKERYEFLLKNRIRSS